MSLIDQAMKANEQFSKRYDPKLGGHPQPKIAIVTCMDPRLSDLEGILGLDTADMDVIRTGGPAFTDDVSLPATDGYLLGATLFLPLGAKHHAVLINSATAVPRQVYRGFAGYLAKRGCAVFTTDCTKMR